VSLDKHWFMEAFCFEGQVAVLIIEK
jgi:hypothetical protein